jgi:hypothetical protein
VIRGTPLEQQLLESGTPALQHGPFWGTCLTPTLGSQLSAVQGLLSSMATGRWVMTPVVELHASTVQGFPSSTTTWVWVIAPVDGLQASMVQALPSLTGTAVCVIAPVVRLQASTVQALPSFTTTAVWVITPVPWSHESIVQGLLSVTSTGVPSQAPRPLQWSPVEHNEPSLQIVVLDLKLTNFHSPVVVLHCQLEHVSGTAPHNEPARAGLDKANPATTPTSKTSSLAQCLICVAPQVVDWGERRARYAGWMA